MIYLDLSNVRLQKRSLRYAVYGEFNFILNTKLGPMHIEFPNNKPIGPTMLVEWLDD